MKPPLPEYADAFRPRWPGDEGGYDAIQLVAYADTYNAALSARVAELEADAKRLREALEALLDYSSVCNAIDSDHLDAARAAIDAAMKETASPAPLTKAAAMEMLRSMDLPEGVLPSDKGGGNG